ncbi:MAG: hypothetical protein A2504_16235 [Bdellovibrionales bacterium RIFOXYD12_FULL_39_22]|nr:MAG: hypothetical protein A2385_08145 [Bdellovibrionales bacterium RIFOXYB1_FULL_39_21]OFZ42972.1 MAG: hypothetical protein A2485_11080 [Bdellovibrionales bacterium RIFOXYC12_FULL_39_17]OFZ50942.1 MAG: hypothetical protein A2404_07060 [Bdellovibrionales bacterium RIFOXYC1_FULL_39_130]OFZ78165.1 MAG: hypothetical protein A2560_02230 [Bdellovibrionales bacterium RIFOXYD1_FULL_39_84]OFZ94033.1 MAG: hypothetical protein A2504_16235 [Bdellovibrionales bacterium RIFOXYD12_FULL_39_22]HLE10485.1 DU
MKKIVTAPHLKSPLCKSMKEATTLQDRIIGLMFSKTMETFDGLMITPCNSIHTFFMRYPIDVIFLDKNFIVVKIIRNLSPWRITWIYLRAVQVLELPANTIPDNLKINDKIEVLCTN